MTRNTNRQEAFEIAAERMRLKKEKEEREDREFYERITSGPRWLLFKVVVFFCLGIFVVSTFEYLVDGPTKKLKETAWKIDRTWEYTWHYVLDVEGYMFTPALGDWSDRVEHTLHITYTPIFRTGKKLVYKVKNRDSSIRRHEEIRQRTTLTWFPAFQIFLLIPFITYLFKRQSPWFNFGRISSLVFVFPATLMLLYFTMLN